MKLSGHTRPYAVLGHPIGHTLSPVMHNAAFKALDMDAIYLAFDVEPGKLMNVLPAMRDLGFGGVNLTVPLKETAFKGLEILDKSAVRAGAVNTIEFLQDGTIKGHSTDGKGFLLALEESFGLNSINNTNVFVLGTGGAGRTLALTCADEGAGSISLADIDLERASKVREEILNSTSCNCSVVDEQDKWTEEAAKADLVIQATPVGMKETDSPLLPTEAFRERQCVFDLIYMYPQTGLMKTAAEQGAKTANGLGMLLHQGARSFTIWTGKQPDVEVMRRDLEKEVYK